MFFFRRDDQPEGPLDPVDWVTDRDRRSWKPLYPGEARHRQRMEGWLLFCSTVVVVASIYVVWAHCGSKVSYLALAGLGGVLGGLLQDSKFFYKSVGDGNWIWDKSWWRLLTPLTAGAMGFSVYLIFRAGTFMAANTGASEKEEYYAYGIGFLTGLFADNALQKLRDIAYTLFGTPKDPPHRLHKPTKQDDSKDNDGTATQ